MTKTILILTNKDDVTVDYIVMELQRRKIKYYRLNTEDIPSSVIIDFDITNNSFGLYDIKKDFTLDLSDITAVYYRRPLISDLNTLAGISTSEKEYLRSELTYILEGIYKVLRNKYWLNYVYRIREAENKIYQLIVAKELGVKLPESIITNSYNSIIKFIGDNNDNIIKPIKSGHLKKKQNSAAIFTSKYDLNENDQDRLELFPNYLQRNIIKSFDIRCIVVGSEVFVAEIHSQNDEESVIDWRRGKNVLKHSKHVLPDDIKIFCISITRKFELNYSAIDFILDTNGDYYFLEINPNGQWAWIENRLGYPISSKIVDMLVNEGE
ncbi:MAG: hypothetical protein JJE17_00485 [Peptostreptococcaceae bacterium]|nr:hypothetical protein [Peptostreptococcaceae bacterium]